MILSMHQLEIGSLLYYDYQKIPLQPMKHSTLQKVRSCHFDSLDLIMDGCMSCAIIHSRGIGVDEDAVV